MSDHGDNDEDTHNSSIPLLMNKPNLYVGVAIASILIATPFILYNYCYSDSSSTSSSTKILSEPRPLDENNNEQSIAITDQIRQTLENLQQSLFKVETKINQTNENVEALRESSKLPIPATEEKEKEKSMFDFSNLNPFSTKPKETSGPPPITSPIQQTPMPDYQAPPEPSQPQPPPYTEPFQVPTENQGQEQGQEQEKAIGQGLGEEEEVPLQEEEQPQVPPQKTTIGGRRTRRKKSKQNYSKKLMAKFLAKLSKI
jgi:hypothetical protein